MSLGSVKVVTGGFQSGGTWVETGNRLPDDWKPLPLGQCAAVTPFNRPFQAVGYQGDGTTCNFQNYYAAMPQLHRDGYLIAASQDVYNGFHMPDDYNLNPRSPLAGPGICDINLANFNEADSSKMCGQGCGECYLITGPAGSQIYIVNEIGKRCLNILKILEKLNFLKGDIGTVGVHEQGVNMNLGWGQGGNGNTCN